MLIDERLQPETAFAGQTRESPWDDLLRRAVELCVTFIDTAGSYGPEISERLIREALHPYPDDLVIASKGMSGVRPARRESVAGGDDRVPVRSSRRSHGV